MVQSDRIGPGIKRRRGLAVKDPKGRREMVIDKVCVINKTRMSATTAAFSTKHCAWSMLKRGRIENTHLAKDCSYGAIANRVLYTIDLLHPLLQSWSCSILPVKVSFRGLFASSTMSYWWNIELTKKT